MFVCIRHGDNDSLIMNIDCGLKVFTECLRKKCKIEQVSEKHLDLSDEFGNVKDLSGSRDPFERVDTLLIEREKYILVELTNDKNNEVEVVPLLKNWIPRTGNTPEPPKTPEPSPFIYGEVGFGPRHKLKTYTKVILAANRIKK